MAILFHCDCGQRLKAPDGMAGRKAKCFQCGAAVRVPEPFLAPSHEPPPEPPRNEPVDLGVECEDEFEASPPPPSPPLTKPMRRPGRWYYPVLVASNLVSFVLGAALIILAVRERPTKAQFDDFLVHYQFASNPIRLADLELMRPVGELEPIVDAFRERLRKADRMFEQDENEIVTAVTKAVLALRSAGRPALPSEILETYISCEHYFGGSRGQDFNEWLKVYHMLREPNHSHTRAAINLVEVLQATLSIQQARAAANPSAVP